MPRSASYVPAFRHHAPSDQAVVTLGGNDVYLGRWGDPSSKEQYDRLIQQWLANGRRVPSAEKPSELTVANVLVAYLGHARTYYVKNGEVTSEYDAIKSAIRPIEALYSRVPANEFRPLALKAVQEELINRGMCRSTINKHTGRIKRIFKWATENELVAPSTHHAVQAVSGLRVGRSKAREKAPVKPVPQAYIDAVLPFVSNQVKAMIQLQEATGMRPGEVTIMRGCDMETTGKIWTYVPASHKTEHHGISRPIYLGPKAQEILRPFLKTDVAAYLFDPRDAESARNARRRKERQSPMTPSHACRKRKAKPKVAPLDYYTTDSYRRAIARACQLADRDAHKIAPADKLDDVLIPTWHPHQLRHNCATRLRKEFGIEAARVVLGHRSAAVTEVYAELDHSKAATIMERVG